MKKKLILAEKPSVARDIARVLKVKNRHKSYFESEDKIVTWALGHLVTLSTPEEYDKKYTKWNLEDLPIIPKQMKLSIIKSSRAQFNEVKQLMNRADVEEIIIATDAGREGELVARLIIKMAGAKKPLKRLWISSVTDKAIRDGFNKLQSGDKFYNLYESAMARSQADWLVGINGSRALTVKHNARLSCGRVQTPTLSMIKNREEEIAAFVPKDYYRLKVRADLAEFNYIDSNGVMSIYNKEEVEKVENDIKGKSIEILKVDEKTKKTYPKELYNLTNLQRDANVRYGFSAKETLNIMQNLYERRKILTYPRTDSKYISEDIVPTIPERLRAISTGKYRKFANNILKTKIHSSKRFVDNTKISDHHAIIPTEETLRIEELDDRELKIYDLVVKRFLSNLMPAYEYKEIKVEGKCENHKFISKGKVELNLGYKELDDYSEDEEEFETIKNVKVGDRLKIINIKRNNLKTSPPALFTEGSLLLAMENPQKIISVSKDSAKTLKTTGGIGTVATRGDIIEKLFSQDLIEKQGQDIVTTQKGKQLLELVPEELKSPELTAQWEVKLQEIEQGKLKSNSFMKDIVKFTNKNTEEIKNTSKNFKHHNITNIKCEICGKLMLRVNRGNSEMLICSDSACSGRKTISYITNIRCPECKKKLKFLKDSDNYICENCGYRQSKENMDKKFAASKNKMKKSEVKKYLNNQKDSEINNILADKLKGLNLK